MTTAEHTAQVAAEVWALMLQEGDPMPVWVARDYVMDKVGCERSEVLGILVDQAVKELERKRPHKHNGNRALANLAVCCWDWVDRYLDEIRRSAEQLSQASNNYSRLWINWTMAADYRVQLLKELQRAD